MARGQARPWGRGERGGTLVLASSGGIAAGCGGGGGGGRDAGSCVPWLGKGSTCECARGRLRLESGRARTVALAASVVVEIGEGSFCRKLP